MQSADFLSAVFFYLKVGENLNQNWIVENLNNAFSTWNGKLGELWGLVTTGPQTFKGGAVWSVMQTLHNGMVGIGYTSSEGSAIMIHTVAMLSRRRRYCQQCGTGSGSCFQQPGRWFALVCPGSSVE